MTVITNTRETGPGIGMPDGRILEPGASLDYPGWDKIKDRPNIAAHVDAGTIKTGGKVPAEPVVEESEQDKAARVAAEAAAAEAEAAANADKGNAKSGGKGK